jgi:hypothetical protein
VRRAPRASGGAGGRPEAAPIADAAGLVAPRSDARPRATRRRVQPSQRQPELLVAASSRPAEGEQQHVEQDDGRDGGDARREEHQRRPSAPGRGADPLSGAQDAQRM